MVTTRRRMRSSSAKFLGALLGVFVFLLLVLVFGGVGTSLTDNASLFVFLIGVALAGLLGAWLLPWIQKRYSSSQMRKKALRQARESVTRGRDS